MNKILLFDYDGTIIDSLDVAFKAFNLIAFKYGLVKMKNKKEFAKLYNNNFYKSLTEMGLDEKDVQNFNIRLRDAFLKEGYGSKIFSGMKDVVNKLAEDNKIIVITSNITSTIKSSINELGLNIHEVYGGDIEQSKVKKILMVKNNFPKSEIYYIGDTMGDVLEGKKARVKTVAVTWGYHSRKQLLKAKPDFVVDNPEGLLNIFD